LALHLVFLPQALKAWSRQRQQHRQQGQHHQRFKQCETSVAHNLPSCLIRENLQPVDLPKHACGLAVQLIIKYSQ
jgi:hypothetical protein